MFFKRISTTTAYAQRFFPLFLFLSLPLSPSLLPFTSSTRIVFAAKPVCKRYCALISLESWQPASNMCHIVILPHSLTLAALSFHICQNEIRVSFCQPLLSHSPAPPLSRSFTHSSAAAAAAAHNSINCPKLTVRQPFIYLSNPLCRRSLALSLSLPLSSSLLSYFIPLLLLLLVQRIRFMYRRLFRIPKYLSAQLTISHFSQCILAAVSSPPPATLSPPLALLTSLCSLSSSSAALIFEWQLQSLFCISYLSSLSHSHSHSHSLSSHESLPGCVCVCVRVYSATTVAWPAVSDSLHSRSQRPPTHTRVVPLSRPRPHGQ